jgi:hypothetical protein
VGYPGSGGSKITFVVQKKDPFRCGSCIPVIAIDIGGMASSHLPIFNEVPCPGFSMVKYGVL